MFLSLLMPLGVGAQTNYDLWIGNTQVTSANALNIQAENLTEGTAVFDANTNTLTLTGANIGYGGVQSGLGNLTIVFNGANTIESYIGANSEVAGTHNLTLKSGSEGSTMYLDNTIGKSIIDGFDNLSLDGLYVSSGSPFAYNATAKQYRSVQYSGIVIQKATITTVPHYALWVGYVQVSDENKSDLFPNDPNDPSLAGKVSFNSTNNTLSLQDVNLDYNVLNHLSNLTISVSGDCKIGSGDSATAVRNTYPNGTLTLKSTGDGNQLAFNNSRSVRDFSSIELTGLNWDDNYSYESATVTAWDSEKQQEVEYVGMHLLKSDGTEAAKAVATTGTPYPLWVAGIRVTSINASNITGNGVEGEVTFDGVNTLNLTSAHLSGPIQTSLANLIVEIDEPCILSVDQYAFIANESTCKITFATKDPENSSITVSYVQSAPFSGFADGNIIFTNDLEGKIVSGQYSDDYVIAVPNDSYGFSVELATGAVEVTKQNRLTIGDGVKFDGQNTLILTNANINKISISADHNLKSGLKIYLIGDNNKIGSQASDGLVNQSDKNIPLTFATSDLEPGTLALSYSDQPLVGFTPTFLNNLLDKLDPEEHIMHIAPGLDPVVDESGEVANLDGGGTGLGTVLEGHETDTQVITDDKKMLLTLGVDDGFFSWTSSTTGEDAKLWDGEESAKLVVLSTEQNGVPENKEPTTSEFATGYKGVTMAIPAGSYEIACDYKNLGTGQLVVQVGRGSDAQKFYMPPHVTHDRSSIQFVTQRPQDVFLYNGTIPEGFSRFRAPGRKMANTTTLKSVKVSARSVAATPPPVLMPKVLTKDDVAAAKSGNHITITDTDVTDYADNAFEGQTGITYVDLSATSITGKKIDRKELPDDATVFLPASNDDNSEKNIVIAGVCNDLQLNEGADFEIPSDFTAVKASLSRNFTSDLGKNCTVCVPFALDDTQAAKLGTFYTLSAHSGNTITMERVDATEANKAYMFKPVKETFSAEMVDVKKADPVRTTVSPLSFLGTYQKITGLNSTADFVYYCFMQTGPQAGKFVKITSAVDVNPFRAYMELPASESLARVLDLNFGEGGATGIGSLTPNPSPIGEGNVGFYDLQGRRVLYPKKGLYILNGKKVIIK